MSYTSLRDFIEFLDRKGELRRIKHPVSAELEITEIADRVMKSPGGGKALLFENVAGYDIPVAINLFGSVQRMAWALGADDLDRLAGDIEALIALPGNMPKTALDYLTLAPKVLPLANIAPKMVTGAACQQIVLKGDDASLDKLPIITCWPGDGGPFVTLPLVITKEAGTGKRNVGMYRLQKYDSRTTGMHWQRHKVGTRHYAEYEARGKDIPVAVALGGDPVLTYASTAPLPDQIDEFVFAGYLRKRPIELVKCVSVDLEVPADADIVIEGVVPANERRREGPFGDHTGYYSLADDYPVFHITAVTMRKNPIYPATIVGVPPMEDAYLGKATERLFLPLVKMVLPEVIDYNLPVEGAFHNLALVRIKKRYPGHAYKVMHSLWGLGQMMMTKVIIVVDEDVDVQNPVEVVWRTLANIDPQRDIAFVKGPVDDLDHASVAPAFGSKMGIDATKKYPEEGFSREWPPLIEMSDEVKKKIDRIWGKLGI
jgi:4-hydroxy-3-polyprenylbenzoate decarboxylase